MVTKNFISIVQAGLQRASGRVKLINGSMSTTNFDDSFYVNGEDRLNTDYSSGSYGSYLLIGAGATPPTIDDYKLESLISNYKVLAQTHTTFSKYSASAFIITRTIQNPNTTEPLTIKEVGLFGGDSTQLYMIAREVLDEPVILQPGEKHAFTMTIGLE